MRKETFLPCFPGFYGTYLEPEFEYEIDYIYEIRKEYGLNEIEPNPWDYFDNDAYELDVCKSFADLIDGELSDFVKNIKIQSIVHPREYNFTTDSVNIELDIDIKAIQRFIYKNLDDFESYLKEKYTSRDGFMSFYSNQVETWRDETDNFTELDEHRLGSILEFILEMICDDVNSFQFLCMEYIYTSEYITNNGLYDLNFCNVCNEFTKDFSEPFNCCIDCIEHKEPLKGTHVNELEMDYLDSLGSIDIYKIDSRFISANFPLINRIHKIFDSLDELKLYYS